MCVRLGEGRDQRLDIGPVGAQQRNEREVAAIGRDTAPGHYRERTVRAHFDERGHAEAGKAAHPLQEPHGLPRVPHPVFGLAHLVGRHLPGHVRHQRNHRLCDRQARYDLPELGQHRLHPRRMECVADSQAPCLTASLSPRLRQADHGVLVTGDHHLLGTVHRGDADPVRDTGQLIGDLSLGGLYRRHRPAGREPLHQPTSGGHQGARVGQRQRSRCMGRRELAHGVPHHRVRDHSPRLQQPEHTNLKREQRRLGKRRLVQQCCIRRTRLGEYHLTNRPD